RARTARIVLLFGFALGGEIFGPLAHAAELPASRPFPQHTIYATGSIKPALVKQEQLDEAALAFYRNWKTKYLVESRTPGQFYVRVDEEENGRGPRKIAVSEGHGYGMLIVA